MIIIISIIIILTPIIIKFKKNDTITIFTKQIIINSPRKQEDYLLSIEIPKIELYKKVYNFNSSLNDISKNIEILESSSLENNNIILASHSGTNKNAYFNNLVNLSISDLIYIYYKEKKYIYQIDNIYYINKTGYLQIPEHSSNMLFLITCSLIYNNKQLIISSHLIN